MRREYPYALSVTSQFYYCALPLRLDAYSTCTYGCLYCFALARGGARSRPQLEVANSSQLQRRLERVARGQQNSVIDELLAQRQPIHLGGMSDPFPPAELRLHATLSLLNILADYSYPTVISTKSDLFARDEYLRVLTRGNFVIQVSLSSRDDRLIRQVDLRTAGPKRLLEALKIAADSGIVTACRIQPLLPSREEDAKDLIPALASVGVRHVAAEHLKLPIETSWRGTAALSALLGVDLSEAYRARGSRVGREWVLPIEDRLNRILELRGLAHDAGLTFGAADNDLLLLSDGQCCCSGVDIHAGFSGFFRGTYTAAARKAVRNGRMTWDLMEQEWTPSRSIQRYVNSRSRLAGTRGRMIDYLRANWSGRANGNSPSTFYGVEPEGEPDDHGRKAYSVSPELKRLLAAPAR